jgi:hypothetical protein
VGQREANLQLKIEPYTLGSLENFNFFLSDRKVNQIGSLQNNNNNNNNNFKD